MKFTTPYYVWKSAAKSKYEIAKSRAGIQYWIGREEDNHKLLQDDVQGMLPLHWSCLCGHLSVTNLLISKNMIDSIDAFGRTPSMLAASSGNLHCLKVWLPLHYFDFSNYPIWKLDEDQWAWFVRKKDLKWA